MPAFPSACAANWPAHSEDRYTGPWSAETKTPILLVEDRTYADAFLMEAKQRRHTNGRAALRKTFDELVAAGDANLAYLPGEHQLAADGESTVDGSHPTDLGFVQQADAFQPALEKLLRGSLER